MTTMTETITGFAGLAVVFAIGIYWAIRSNRKPVESGDTGRVVSARHWKGAQTVRVTKVRRMAA